MIHQRKILKAIAYAILLCFTSLTGAQPLYAIPANTQLPTGPGANGYGNVTHGVADISVTGNTMNIEQSTNTSVIQWDNFSIGADAAVNFVGKGQDNFNGFNSLNYVTGANAPISEIYGQLTALGGNIFIANPAGVQIGNSAQINVGSLYVTNKDIGQAIKDGKLEINENTIDVANKLQSVAATNAELMSLGAIVNAKNVTFDGGRIVLDTDRIYADNAEGELQPVADESLKGGMLNIITTDKDNVVLGSSERAGIFNGFSINGGNNKLEKGYTWVHDLGELQAMNEDTSGWYALRNSIDANATAGTSFDSIGTDAGRFTGRFDGLGYSIFGLNIDKDGTKNIGLFGYAQNATIRNFTLNSSEIKGGANTGAAVGHADGGKIENVTNTGNVTGGDGTGGVVGKAENKVAMSGLINIGKVTGGVGTGGVVGSMSGGTLGGDTYNLGSVTGTSSVGGIVGSVTNATIGNEVTQDNPDAFQIFNQLNVTGNYNVGGIAGTMSGGKITNAANHGNVTATGFTKEAYQYHKGNAVWINNNKDLEINDNSLDYVSDVHVANTGGIVGSANGSELSKVENTGNVTTSTTQGDAQTGNYYNAGNIGGIVGRAENTIINNAENKENFVAGANNVGGVAGFLTGTSNINVASNNGGDITATGARTDSGFAREYVRGVPGSNENFIIGNIGGVVGYIFGEDAKVQNSGNRGTVHSAEIKGTTVLETAQAANVGGVVGKISSETIGTQEILEKIAEGKLTATVSNSYNTGDVRGYTGVGGVVGQMFNGSISGSYNLGKLEATRTVDASSTMKESLNMGGIVGDTSEESKARAVIYDVYNAGQIGDEDFYFRGRHVGGIAGRLSGFVDKAYNTGDIYNGYSTVGGIAGWWFAGKISNVFNTGNITVKNFDAENKRAQVGGIVGDAGTYAESLIYAYNLGTIRSFAPFGYAHHVGGIAGRITDNLKIDNVYTLGNLYAATAQENANDSYTSTEENLGAIYGSGGTTNGNITNANYITPDNPTDDSKPKFVNLSEKAMSQGIKVVAYKNRSDTDAYELGGLEKLDTTTNWSVNDGAWRLYEGGTPILNEFTPYAEDYFSANYKGINSIQYGTAYNPMLTIVNIGKDSTLEVDWHKLNMRGAGGLAVYGGGLTLTDFRSAGDGRYFGGTIFSEGELNITGTGTNFNLGSASKLYGSSVKLNANGGDISAYGEVTSTNGNIEVSGKNVEIIGSLTAKADGKTTEIDGISGASTTREMDTTNLNDPDKAMKSVSDMFTYTTGEAGTNGDITVNASGAAEVLYGNLGTGSVSTAGNFTVNGGTTDGGKTFSGGSVYVDSDLSGTTGDINLSAGGEVLLDITNIAKANKSDEDKNGAVALHTFLDNHSNGTSKITLDSANDDEIIAIDMWNGSAFDLDKYNDGDETFVGAIQALGEDLAGKTHIWISDANQLKGIQSYAETNGGSGILGYNFALKGNIDASALEDYKAIGGEAGYSGTFDGRGFRIIGLNASATDADSASSGIFSRLTGTVKDLRVYASKFFGGDGESVGAIASEVTEGGKITGVTTFGNTVTAANGAAGGIAGKNSGSILESTASDSVTASGTDAYAGGVAGVNTGSIGEKGEEGESAQITADSAVRSGTNGAAAIGGVVGKNETDGEVWLANSLGVTTGANAESTGGIAGTNSGTMTSLYNESIVTGESNVGGVAGNNSGTMKNAVNATRVTGTGTNTGGLVGNNSGTVDSGRNAGTINGTDNVGGMVGSNGEKGILKNLSNAIVAAITGTDYVGGIAGSNAGSITSDNNLTNEGTVSGHTYVGGIAGVNTEDGTIENVLSETLVLKTGNEEGAQYFGGIAGQNSGAITNATNNSNVHAEGATIVGGIVGQNTETGKLVGKLTNKGNVSGKDKVGGLAGENNKLLQGTKDENGETIRLVVTNAGKVSASGGSAGGIFYNNTGNIIDADLTNTNEVVGKGNNATGGLFGTNSGNITNSTLTNTGTVTGNGVTGGLIGENSGAVTGGSKLTNSGTVNGGDNTGGLIGKNSGDVSFSSLINEYGAKVTGGDNTGGLIGYNTGTIKGGRNDAYGKDLGLYTYKIYNNGTVSGASNVGGLIGNNAQENGKTGSLIAGYNTGVVTGSGENVGGIAGTNEGTIDQVFNTVMTGIDELGETLFGAVTGTNNVGGIVGNNTGKLTNAYNTTTVKSDETKGNIAGANSGTVANVYATNETGMLIGTGNATDSYSFSDADNEKEGITVIEPAAKNKQGSYEQFDFSGDSGTPAVWKIYEGMNGQEASGTPLLKVSLTKAEYSGETSFTYNGNNQGLSLDGVTVDGEKLSDVAKTLLSALEGKNAYNGYLGFTSEQIAGSTTMDGDGNVVFNPNNLGYDIDATFDINKAQLSVTLDEISREYGNGQIKNDNATTAGGHYYNNGYGYTVTADNLTQEMIDELGGEGFYTFVRDGAVDGVSGQKKTNDVDSYTWSAAFKLGELAQNYEFADSVDDTLTVDNGVSKVTPATLTIQLDNVNRTYGDISKPQYSIKDDGNLVNGDAGKLFFNAEAYEAVPGDNETYGDGALYTVNGDTRTKDVGGTYYWNVAEQDYAKVFGGINTNNYNITVIKGESNVTPKTLSVSSILATIVYGNQNGKGFSVDVGELTGFAEGYGDEDFVDLNRSYFGDTANGTFSEAYTNSQNGRHTADAGTYKNGITYSGLSGLGLLTGDKAKNYVLADSATGNVEVMKANLNITFNDIWREYGDTAIRDNGSYGYTQTGLVNMDDANIMFNADAASGADGGIIEVDGKQRTNDAGTYNYVNVNDENSVKGLFNNVNFNNYTLKEVSGGNSKVTPKTLSVSDILATIVYGNQNGKGFSVDVGELTGFAEGYGDEDYVDLNRSYFGDTANGTFSEAYTNSQNGRHTADAGTYKNGITYSGLSGLGLLTGGKAKNYVLADSATGNVEVMKADLIVTPNAVSRGYGDLKADYTFSATSLVNDDENYTLTLDETMISDMALVDNKTKTDNVGGYKWTFVKEALGGVENLLRNYDVTVGEADSTVIKADLTIKADDQNMLIGTTPNFTGTTLTELANQLVNGDSLPDGFSYLFGVGDEAIFSEVGTHADAIGLFYNGAFYGGGLTGWGGVFANYDVNFVPGTLTVVPPSTDNYGHLHSDGWDRVRNFRERKAEVFFHEGGMEYDEDM